MVDLKRVVQILKENNVADEDIAKFIVDLNNVVSEKVYIELVGALDEKDFAAIEKVSDEQGDGEVKKRFQEKTGKSVDQLTTEILDGFVTTFLTEYNREKLKEAGTSTG